MIPRQLACTSGHLDARSRSNVEFHAISLAFESQPSSALCDRLAVVFVPGYAGTRARPWRAGCTIWGRLRAKPPKNHKSRTSRECVCFRRRRAQSETRERFDGRGVSGGLAANELEMCMHNQIPVREPAQREREASYSALGAGEQAMFTQAMQAFMEVDSVSGGIEGEDGTGLGPGFMQQLRAVPRTTGHGGSSPGSKSPQNPVPICRLRWRRSMARPTRCRPSLLRTGRCAKHASL